MGVYYYIVNHQTKQYIGHLGKIGEFDTEEICFYLDWNPIDCEVIPEDNMDKYLCDDNSLYVRTNIKNIELEYPAMCKAYNLARKEKYEFPYMYINPANKNIILEKLGWTSGDKVIYTNKSECSYYYPDGNFDWDTDRDEMERCNTV